MVVVNSAMIMTYYKIGTIINKRKTWGSKYIQRLSNDLKENGKGYSYQNLKFMSQFSKEFKDDEIGLQAVSQIPWGTLTTVIMTKSKSHEEMLWYIKETIKQKRNKAMVVVNSAMIITYYEIGTIINKRKTWGSKYIERLSNDLKEYGKGYSIQNLKRMSLVANEFSYNEISSQLVSQIPWGTLTTVIMTKSKSHEEMLWYINETHRNGWSRATVLKQIAMKDYLMI